MLNLPVYRCTVSMKSRLAIFLILLFGISIWLPFASAAEMPACNAVNGGHCDGWDSADDGTPNQQDWIEGVYEFNLVDTSTIEMEMTWALREFNRSMLGFDDDPNIAAALSAMGFIRKYANTKYAFVRHTRVDYFLKLTVLGLMIGLMIPGHDTNI